MKPLFMWAGGKNKMLSKYEEAGVLPPSFGSYIEPFFGGGAMFIWAYKQNPEATFHINDINPHIIGIYKAVRDDCEVFCDVLNRLEDEYLPLPTPKQVGTNKELQRKHKRQERGRHDWDAIFNEEPTRRHFYFKLRDHYAWNYEKWSPTFEAAVLYFLMKTGFNGIWQLNANTNNRFGTPCGLLNQKDKVYDRENVAKWNKALQRSKIYSGDFAEILSCADSDSFVFLDPPYRGSFADYGTAADDGFQERVIKFLNDCTSAGAYAIMSNRDMGDGFFEERSEGNEILYFDITYTAGRRKKLEDGTFQATKATEILMKGKANVRKP